MRYTFEWDPRKAKENLRKHRVSFDRAAELFRDPVAISLADEEHSETEERWVTIGAGQSWEGFGSCAYVFRDLGRGMEDTNHFGTEGH